MSTTLQQASHADVSSSLSSNHTDAQAETFLQAKPQGPQKIIDLLNQGVLSNRTFFSFEYFPPKTDLGVTNLVARMGRMASCEPLFMDITWGAGGTTSSLTLNIATSAQQAFRPEIMMHLTCTNMPVATLRSALDQAKEAGIRNILALRGDPPKGTNEEDWKAIEGGFQYAEDLVKFIREEYNNWFGIAVAGYPEGHMSCTSLDDDIQHLKTKIDAGADFVVTQLFYDADLFIEFVHKCRAVGITCPIIPGIMPLQNYASFMRMTGFCKTHVPQHILDALEPIKDDDNAVREYGIVLAAAMCKKLFDANIGIPGVHLYTLNLQKSCMGVLQALELVAPETVEEITAAEAAHALAHAAPQTQ